MRNMIKKFEDVNRYVREISHKHSMHDDKINKYECPTVFCGAIFWSNIMELYHGAIL